MTIFCCWKLEGLIQRLGDQGVTRMCPRTINYAFQLAFKDPVMDVPNSLRIEDKIEVILR